MSSPAVQARWLAQPGTLGWLLPLAFAVACFAAGATADGWILDDTVNLAQHAAHGDVLGEWLEPTYRHAGGGSGHIWRPVPASLQHLAAVLFGRTPPVFRLLSLAVHLLNVLLVYRLARVLGAGGLAAGLAALCFTMHPALPEAVCWSSDIYDLVLATMLLLATWAAVALPTRAARVLGGSALLLLACLCKETAVAFVPVLALFALVRWGWREALAMGLAAVGAAGLWLVLHGQVTGQGYGAAGAQSPIAHQLAAWLTSTGWLLWVPTQAPLSHFFDPEAWVGPALGLATLASLGGLSLVARRRIPEGGALLAVAGCAWACLLAPTGPAVPMIGLHSFRYVYAPLAVFAAVAAPAAAVGIARLPRWLSACLLLAWCAAGAWMVTGRVGDWRNPQRLFQAELSVEPGNPYAATQLARLWAVSGHQVEASLDAWAQALDTPTPPSRLFNIHRERWDLAQTAFLAGYPERSLVQVQRLIADAEAQGWPPPSQAYCLVADSLDALGRPGEAQAVEHLCPLPTPRGRAP